MTATIDVGRSPEGVAVAPDGRHLYVTNYLSHDVSVIDTADNKVVATIEVGQYPVAVAVSSRRFG